MRTSFLLVCWLVFQLPSACVSAPSFQWHDTFQTSSGARVYFTPCKIGVVSGDYTFKFINVRVDDHGKVRTDPKIRFDKPGVAEMTGSQGNSVLYMMNNLVRDACSDVRELGPAQAKLAQEFYDRAVRYWFETAFNFEKLTIEEELRAAVVAGNELYKKLAAEQRSGYSKDASRQ